MKVIIFGGTGFIGKELCQKLINQGHAVVAIHHSPILESEMVCGVEYKQMDIDSEWKKVEQVLKGQEFVFWSMQPNISRMQQIGPLMIKMATIQKIVYLSTTILYPNSTESQNEQAVPQPLSAYEMGKYEEEKMLKAMVEEGKIDLIIARLGNVYGNHKNKGILNSLFLSLLNGKKLTVNGNGGQIRDYIFIDDVVDALTFFIGYNQKEPVEIVNISTGVGTSIRSLLEYIYKITGNQIEVESGLPLNEKFSIIGDNTRLKKISGIMNFTDIKTGLEKTYKNYLNHTN